MRRWILLALKLGISAGLLYWAFHSVDLGAVAGHLGRLDALWVAAALAVLAVQIAVAGRRWAWIATKLGAALPMGRAIRYSFAAAFFNQALPSTVGGDAMRVWLLGRADRQWKRALYSVFVDRAAGVGFLAVLVAVCLPWSLDLIAAPEGRAAVLLIGLGGVAGLVFGLALGFAKPGPRLAAWRLARLLLEIGGSARAALLDGSRGLAIAVLSIVIHLLTVAAAWCLAHAIAISPNALSLLIVIPPVMLISMIPISIGGWGIRESAMVVAFGYAGIESSQALTVSVLLGVTTLAVSIVGGIIWLAERNPARAATGVQPHR
jgi:glycosyltransferase 2 family protein